MIQQTSGGPHYAIAKGLIFSCIIHAAFFIGIVFTFTAYAPAYKPSLFFLGSFLTKNDFTIGNGHVRHQTKNIPFVVSGLYESHGSQQLPLNAPSTKPAFSQQLTSGDKKSLKQVEFDITAAETRGEEDSDLAITTAVPARLPLALDSQ